MNKPLTFTDEEAIATAMLLGADLWFGEISREWYVTRGGEAHPCEEEQMDRNHRWGWRTRSEAARAYVVWCLRQKEPA